jgi:hypothetical protein
LTTLLIISADHHINSTVALCPPIVNLDDGGTYHASAGQRWLWDSWLEAWEAIGKIKARRKILVLNGDLGELDTKRRSNQIVTPNKATIQGMVTDVLAPALRIVGDTYIVRGTAAHQGKSSWLEEAIASDTKGVIKPPGSSSWWQIVGQVEGVRVDIAHHGGMSGSPWGKYNAPAALWTKVLWEYKVERNLPPPHLVIRSHNHVYVEGANALFTPCWSMITEYGYRTGRENSRPTIGLVIIEIDGDQWRARPMIFRQPTDDQAWETRL